MHEQSLIADLMRKIEAIRLDHNAGRVVGVKVRLGALSHISAEHFRQHFIRAARGTAAEGASLDIEVMTDATDPHAQDILLESLEVEE
ncbi:MAG: hydrogenase/urease maturation nickel metallochaperone HypA [Blastocatellia bacterium]|nr:hydrogenase/urease maturation nickel metallochaperone HypA [Blastocatellia bacterium]